jgi:2-desacetyl-2-hydroxyethyl bacteriochlorophyllide A dehydrogenase
MSDVAQAIWFSAPRTVEVRTEATPPPGPGALYVAALASAISHGTEMLVYRGEAPADLALDLPTLTGSYAFPIKYGYACVGQVIDVGPEVTGFAPGDTIFCLHPHQSRFVIPNGLALKLPPGIDPLWGVFCANVETALGIVHDAGLRLGETALVCGLGVVGLLTAQLLQKAGAGVLIGVEPNPQRAALARTLGVDVVLAPGPNLAAQVRELTDGRGVDVAVEVSGAPAALQVAIDSVAVEGTVVAASWYGTKPVSLDLGGHFHRGRVRLRSSQVGRLAPELGPRWNTARRMATVLELLPRLRLNELISHRFPLSAAAAAYALVDSGAAEVVQVVFAYGAGGGGGGGGPPPPPPPPAEEPLCTK